MLISLLKNFDLPVLWSSCTELVNASDILLLHATKTGICFYRSAVFWVLLWN